MYLATCTRPDISYTVGVLARFISNPGRSHFVAAMHLLCYLKSSIDLKLVYGPSDSEDGFLTYTDADHGGNPDNGLKSTGGYLVTMSSGAISWSSKLQSTVCHEFNVFCLFLLKSLISSYPVSILSYSYHMDLVLSHFDH